MRSTVLALWLLVGCAKAAPSPPLPAASVRVNVAGPAAPGDSATARVSAAGRYVVVRGVADLPPEAGLYGDLDPSSSPTLRLTLYDSVPGRALDAPRASTGNHAVVFEARIGPLAPDRYEVTVGRYDADSRLIVVREPPQPVVVRAEEP